jgi:hypothetical protein
MGHNSILLGGLIQDQCRILADLNADSDFPGVIGPDLTARWFTDRARELGLQFLEPEPQQIYPITDKPRYPGSWGQARPATIEDATILADWLLGFCQEAVPNDPIPSREELEQATRDERFLFWIVDGQPHVNGGDRASLENVSGHYGRPGDIGASPRRDHLRSQRGEF